MQPNVHLGTAAVLGLASRFSGDRFEVRLHALQGECPKTSDPQAMPTTQGESGTASIRPFEPLNRKVRNRSFRTKPILSRTATPIEKRIAHFLSTAACRMEVHGVGNHAQDVSSADGHGRLRCANE